MVLAVDTEHSVTWVLACRVGGSVVVLTAAAGQSRRYHPLLLLAHSLWFPESLYLFGGRQLQGTLILVCMVLNLGKPLPVNEEFDSGYVHCGGCGCSGGWNITSSHCNVGMDFGLGLGVSLVEDIGNLVILPVVFHGACCGVGHSHDNFLADAVDLAIFISVSNLNHVLVLVLLCWLRVILHGISNTWRVEFRE